MAKKPEGGAPPLRFINQENLEAWLKTQPHEVAVAISARAALRVLPLTACISSLLLARHREELILAIIEANAVARVAAKHPSQLIDSHVARRAWEAASAADATDAAAYAAGAAAAFAVTNPARAVARAADATAYARARGTLPASLADSASIVARGTFAAAMWKVVSHDANLIVFGRTASDLASHPLWPEGVPAWATDHWGRLRDALPRKDDWQVWIDWYQRRLAGLSEPEEIELVYATVPKENRSKGPAAANRWIKERLEEIAGVKAAQPSEILSPAALDFRAIDSIPQQTVAATQFTEGGAGPIDVVRDPATSDPQEAADQREHYAEARGKALNLLALGPNLLGDAHRPTVRLIEGMPEHMNDVSIVRLWHRANTLRERLDDHDKGLERSASPQPEPNLAILPYAAAGALRDFVRSYNVFIVGDGKGRELDHKSLGPGERERGEAALALIEPVVAVLPSAPELVTPAVPEILEEQIAAAKAAPSSLPGDQDVALARDSSANWVIALVRKTARLMKDEGAFVSKEVRAGVYRGVGTAIAGGAVIANWPAAAQFVAQYAETLKSFIRLVYNNPSIPQMIDAISRLLLR